MSTHVTLGSNDLRGRIGEPMIEPLPPVEYVPPTSDDRARLRRLEYQVRLLTAAVRALADAVATAGEPDLARHARRLCDHCD